MFSNESPITAEYECGRVTAPVWVVLVHTGRIICIVYCCRSKVCGVKTCHVVCMLRAINSPRSVHFSLCVRACVITLSRYLPQLLRVQRSSTVITVMMYKNLTLHSLSFSPLSSYEVFFFCAHELVWWWLSVLSHSSLQNTKKLNGLVQKGRSVLFRNLGEPWNTWVELY